MNTKPQFEDQTLSTQNPVQNSRVLVLRIMLGTATAIALYLILPSLSSVLALLNLADYQIFRNAGEAFLQGKSPYAVTGFFSPLPVIWVFAILALLPPSFGYIWTIIPFGFLQIILGKKAPSVWLFFPLLVHLRWGQLDGWLFLPIYWLLQNRPIWAGIGAALLIFKPQIALGLLLFRLFGWLCKKDYNNLGVALLLGLILTIPTFIVSPSWLSQWLGSLNTRVYFGSLDVLDASAWALTRGNNIGWAAFVFLTFVVVALVWYSKDRAASALIVGLMFTPYLYAYDLVALLPVVRKVQDGLILVVLSWAGLALGLWLGGFAGAFVIVPLGALILLLQQRKQSSTQVTKETPEA